MEWQRYWAGADIRYCKIQSIRISDISEYQIFQNIRIWDIVRRYWAVVQLSDKRSSLLPPISWGSAYNQQQVKSFDKTVFRKSDKTVKPLQKSETCKTSAAVICWPPTSPSWRLRLVAWLTFLHCCWSWQTTQGRIDVNIMLDIFVLSWAGKYGFWFISSDRSSLYYDALLAKTHF